MFSRELVDPKQFPEVKSAGLNAYQTLVAIASRFAPPRRCEELSLAAWSIAHGYATLCIEAGLEDGSHRMQRPTCSPASFTRAPMYDTDFRKDQSGYRRGTDAAPQCDTSPNGRLTFKAFVRPA